MPETSAKRITRLRAELRTLRAIYYDHAGLQDRCINCGMCAMACPFGVIRYHTYPSHKEAAHKCDQCAARQHRPRRAAVGAFEQAPAERADDPRLPDGMG